MIPGGKQRLLQPRDLPLDRFKREIVVGGEPVEAGADQPGGFPAARPRHTEPGERLPRLARTVRQDRQRVLCQEGAQAHGRRERVARVAHRHRKVIKPFMAFVLGHPAPQTPFKDVHILPEDPGRLCQRGKNP